MKLPFSFKNIEGKRPEWQWSSCKQCPNTLSFRSSYELIDTDDFVYFDTSDEVVIPDTWFTTLNEAPSFLTQSEVSLDGEDSCEAVLQDLLLAERLFFDPEKNRSILKQEKVQLLPFEDSMEMVLESKDPYEDFRRSMVEMVETHGLKEWESLDELLGWYLRVNMKKNHGFIIGAFVDLLVGMISTPCTNIYSDLDYFSSSSSHISTLLEEETIDKSNVGIF